MDDGDDEHQYENTLQDGILADFYGQRRYDTEQ